MSNIAILTDEQGNFIGQKDRYQLEPGDMNAIAALWVVNSRGEMLLAQRSLEKKVDPGMWGPAAAGTLEPGETFESNVVKEAYEEIGLTVSSPQEIDRLHYWRPNGIGRYAVRYKTVADLPADSFVLQKEEVAAVRWIAKQDLLDEIEAHPERFVFTKDNLPELFRLLGV